MAPVHLHTAGIGNGHLTGLESSGSYYVTIMQGTNDVLAGQEIKLQWAPAAGRALRRTGR